MCHKTSIIILSYNTLELLQLCIASIREFTEAGTYEIIVVENASKDGSIEWLKAQTGLTCIYNEENQGFPGGCNQGLEIAAGTELLLLNSDTIVTKDWLKNLRFALYSSPKVGAVSCVTNHCSNNQRIDVSYESIEAMLAFAADYNRSNPALWEKRTKLVGFCFLFKREVFERVGFLDVRFNPGNYEDDDYSLRILRAGYDLLLCRDTFIHHYGGASFEKKLAVRNAAEMEERYNAALMRNHKIFFEKWQAPEDYWKMAPEELLPYLRRQAPEDVSAASAAQTIAVLVRRTNEERYALCLKSLYAANIPAGYALEIFPLSIERSYAAQVNEILARTTAKIKIFMSDDVCLISPMAIEQLLGIFEENSVGMAGILGSRSLPVNGNLLDAPDLWGGVCMPMQGDLEEIRFGSRSAGTFVEDVRFLCPSFFATQIDLAWDESYEGQYYAVLAHCRAVEERGRRIVAPLPQEIWCAYQMGNISFDADEEDRCRFFAAFHPYLGKSAPVKTQLSLYACGKDAEIEGWRSFCHPEGIAVGSRTKIHRTVRCGLRFDNFEGEPRIAVGEDCTIGAYSALTAAHSITLKNLVTVGENVRIADYMYEEETLGLGADDRRIAGHAHGVSVGCAAQIGANTVIEGGVSVGCGACVRAGSVVRTSIPAYCIAEGNPAHVIKAFSPRRGKWLETPDEAALASLLEERRQTPPLLTFAVITYNRSSYLGKSLKSVLRQVEDDPLVEVLVSDNASTDDTRALVLDLQKRYKNLRYHRNEKNVAAEGNIHRAIEASRGEYVLVAGDDDYFLDGALRVLLDNIRKYRGVALLHLKKEAVPRWVRRGKGALEYLSYVGFLMTWISGVVMRRELYFSIEEPHKYDHTRLPQVYLQLEMLKQNPEFAVCYGLVLEADSGDHKVSGFNFGEVFIKNYLDVLTASADIPSYLLSQEKKRLAEDMIYDRLQKITKYHYGLSLDGIFDIVRDYYGEEPYYEEIVSEMKKILRDGGAGESA